MASGKNASKASYNSVRSEKVDVVEAVDVAALMGLPLASYPDAASSSSISIIVAFGMGDVLIDVSAPASPSDMAGVPPRKSAVDRARNALDSDEIV